MELNPNTGNASSTGLPLGSGQKPGERLRQVRLSQKRELADISRELNIPERQLLAIEADDYQSLPQPAFVKGYLRNYARVLGVDGNALVTRFNEIYTHDTGLPNQQNLENSPLKPLARLSRSSKTRSWRWLRWLLLALLLGSLLYGAYAILMAIQPSSSAVNSSTEASSMTAASPVLSQDSGNNTTSTSAPLVATPLAPAANMAANGQDRLILTLQQDAELSVRDAMGKTLVSGLQKTGTPLQIEGMSPFGITLPNAAAVSSLNLNGETVDIKPYIVNGRAEFRLSR